MVFDRQRQGGIYSGDDPEDLAKAGPGIEAAVKKYA
jgi:hypothetical protein